MKKLLLILFLIPNLLMAENVLYCQEELGTGLIKKNGVWKTANFKLERHTIKFNADYTKLDGLTFYPMSCSKPYKHADPEYIACVHSKGSHETFAYNKLTKRFIFSMTSAGGYVSNEQDSENLSAGSCEAF